MNKKLKDKLSFIVAAIPKVAAAYFKRVIGNKANKEVQDFRKTKCLSCYLFDSKNKVCNKDLFVNESKPFYMVSIGTVENNEDIYRQIKDDYGVVRQVAYKNRILTRGCGCSLDGKTAKWKFYFSETDLEKIDGTAPCPLGKWNKENFINWKKQQNEK